MSDQDAARRLRALLRQDLYFFVQKAFGSVNPGEVFLTNWHLKAICFYLEQVMQGKIKRLRIEVPPRSLKSICTSVAFPAYVLGRDPSAKIITASYSADLAAKHSGDCRAVMQSDWYKELFPQTKLSNTRNQELNYETTCKGYRYATSVGGTLTGRGGNLIIIDDPLKPEEAMSQAKREAVNAWYSRTLLSRLNNKSQDAIVIVQQRLHMDDLPGHVDQLDDWTVLRLPAIAEEDEWIPIGPNERYHRKAGEALHPKREPLEILEQVKRGLGSAVFSAQYQQCPVPADGAVIKWDWFRRYDRTPSTHNLAIYQSWDTASKPEEHCDFSVCTTWGVYGNDYYLLHVFRKRMDFPELKRAVIDLGRHWQPTAIIIEDKGSGIGLIQQLRAENHGIIRPTAFTPREDKVTRLHAQSAQIEAGHVWLPREGEWLEDLRIELSSFPNGKHDDQADSISQFLSWYAERQSRRVQIVPLSGI